MNVQELSPVDGVAGTSSYVVVGDDLRPVEGPRVIVIARMHGNEPVGDDVLAWLREHVGERLVRGSLVLVHANQVATRLGLRHTPDGSDLNRLWDAQSLARLATVPDRDRSYEERRALELAPILRSGDAVLDLHSTSRPAHPFLVFRDDQRHAAIAQRLGVARLVTGLHENSILDGGVASNVGLAPAEKGATLGFTFEAGHHTDEGNARRARDVAERLLVELGVFSAPVRPAPPVRSMIYEVVDRFIQALAATEP